MRVQDAAVVIRSLAHTASVPDDVLVSYAALVAADVSETEPEPVRVDQELKQVGARDALLTFGAVLNGWICGARENRKAGMRSDPYRFHAEDIRAMIADAAREIGVEL